MTSETVFIHAELDPAKKQDPFNPVLTERILHYLDSAVITATYTDQKVAGGEPLFGVPQRLKNNHVVVFEALANSMGIYSRDLTRALRNLSDTDCGVEGGIFVFIPFLEARDDRRFRESSEGMLEQYLDELKAAGKNKGITGIAVWEPHSGIGIDALKHLYNGEGVNVLALTAVSLFADRFQYMMDEGILNKATTVVVSPDLGSVARSKMLADELGVSLILTHKKRQKDGEKMGDIEIEGFYRVNTDGSIEDVDRKYLKGMTVLEVDDMYATGGTSVKGAKKLKQELGVSRVIFAATHGVFTTPEVLNDALVNRYIDHLMVTDTLPLWDSQAPDYLIEVILRFNNIDPTNFKDKEVMCRLQGGQVITRECGKLRVIKVPDVEVVSVAEASASLIKLVAGVELSEAEQRLLKRCLYKAGPTKDELLRDFQNRRFLWFSEEAAHQEQRLPQAGTLFMKS